MEEGGEVVANAVGVGKLIKRNDVGWNIASSFLRIAGSLRTETGELQQRKQERRAIISFHHESE